MEYKAIEELLADDGFLAWYYKTDQRQIAIWNAWIAESDRHRLLAEGAAFFLQDFSLIEDGSAKDEAIEVWDRIQASIRRQEAADARRGMTENSRKSNYPALLGSFVKVGLRNLLRNKGTSFINIFGLSMGMAVTLLIGLWIWDELSYNSNFEHYDRIAQVFQRGESHGNKWAQSSEPVPLAEELRRSYPEDFTYVVASNRASYTLSNRDKKFTEHGNCMEPDGADMLSLHMLKGNRKGLKDPASIFLSETTAKKIFGDSDPMGQVIKINNLHSVKVTGVYEDLPYSSDFRDMSFITPWSFFIANWDWIRNIKDNWGANTIDIFVQLSPHSDLGKVDGKIKDLGTRKYPQKDAKMALFLFPMSRWHLYSDFKDGVNIGGAITFVWLFGTIGVFVLLLACINFMNLSTARSEKRAKEVGVRKVMGSLRAQLVGQFFSESLLMTQFALVAALLVVQLGLPWFNEVAGKKLSIPWANPGFWCCAIGFSLVTGFIAGSYPAIYLSSFQPVKVLKGTFRLGRFASIPRKISVVVQFTVSVLLITGTIIVYRQIQYAKNRPVGYDRSGLIAIQETTPEIYTNYPVIRRELLRSGAALELSESQGPVTDIWAGEIGFDWKGKDPHLPGQFAVIGIRHEYGKTVGWQFTDGRDFSAALSTDSDGLVLNEAAVKYMGVKNPVGQTITWNKRNYHVLGVIRDMIMASPYSPVPQSVYYILREGGNFINIRINPAMSTSTALSKMEKIFKTYNPAAPFDYTFTDQEYAKKFSSEERIGTLASFFAILAILISSLGLYGLASFVAEQRTKEIGIRKVLGATLINLWRLLSTEFVLLVFISFLIATPIAYFFMHGWLQQYDYRAPISWWIFAAAGLGALAITLLTVSHQAIRAATMNPVKSLRSE